MSGSQPETDGDMVRVKGQLRGNKTYLAREADDAQVPVIIFVDGNNNKIFLKDVNLSCPSFDPVMSGIYDINIKVAAKGRWLKLNYLLITGSFRASMGLGFDVKRENQNVVKMCTLRQEFG